MCKIIQSPYAAPMCEVLDMIAPEILCMSNLQPGGTTEDVGELDDIFGGNN